MPYIRITEYMEASTMGNATYSERTPYPVAIIGGGPVGVTAAAHLAVRQIPFVLLESGAAVGSAVKEWAHVRMFSPWKYAVDSTAAGLLGDTGWQHPPANELPTGADLIDRYVTPLAQHPSIAPRLRLEARVTSISRKDMDKVRSKGRDRQPFELRLEDGTSILAGAVIDASGTWRSPNPLGSSGLAAPGEAEVKDRVTYGIPDVLQRDRARYTNKTVAVAGSGHSAFNVILDLLTLAKAEPLTRIVWLVRRDS
ncbi:MAG TPA: NAD(P)-binding domain-containing protein, partial [Vicinamibacterales bacterium]